MAWLVPRHGILRCWFLKTTTETHVTSVWFFGRFPGSEIRSPHGCIAERVGLHTVVETGGRIEEKLYKTHGFGFRSRLSGEGVHSARLVFRVLRLEERAAQASCELCVLA
jgi:hypothetical protein